MAAPCISGMLLKKMYCLCRCRCNITGNSTRLAVELTIVRKASAATIASASLQFDPSVEKQLDDKVYKHRMHPGLMKLKSVHLPERLERTVHALIDKYPSEDLTKNAENFVRYLKCRQAPLEDFELRNTARQLEEEVWSKQLDGKNLKDLPDEERIKLEAKVKGNVLKKLREQVYHWQNIEYTAYKGFLYMVGKLDEDYAALMRCLNEINKREPGFIPRTVFDMGSGVGSACWAVHNLWGKSVKEIYCVDRSQEMNTLARLLLQDGEDNKEMCLPGVHFRQFHPSVKNRFDLTVCAFTQLEFPSRRERLEAMENLWHMTNDFMVLVENGSYAGFKLIQEARQFILKLGGDQDGHVFAPCPHEEVCPKLSWTKRYSCTTNVKYKKLQLSTNAYVTETAGLSYVILRKGTRHTDVPSNEWPRVVKNMGKPHAHTPCTVCCPDGSIQSLVITKAKHSKNLYKCSRYCQMGDLLPVRLPRQLETDESNELLSDSNAQRSNEPLKDVEGDGPETYSPLFV